MKVLVLWSIVLALSICAAQASKREDCAAKSGAAFNARISADKGANTNQPKQPLYKDPASRARCRMGNC